MGMIWVSRTGCPICLKALALSEPTIPWIRILYAFPGFVTDRLIEVMAANTRSTVPGYAAATCSPEML